MRLAEGQLRFTGMGGVAGMDLPAVIEVVAAAGVDRASAWVLAPWYEQGMVAGFNTRRGQGGR